MPDRSCSRPAILVAAQQLALQALANLRQQQASALAYFDVFWVLAVVMAALVFVLLLMKRSVAEIIPTASVVDSDVI
ncbi:MAG: hypothetical protein ACREP1_02630 [Rhodanobacteraceae bacterium]